MGLVTEGIANKWRALFGAVRKPNTLRLDALGFPLFEFGEGIIDHCRKVLIQERGLNLLTQSEIAALGIAQLGALEADRAEGHAIGWE